jgi:hypothetical protein
VKASTQIVSEDPVVKSDVVDENNPTKSEAENRLTAVKNTLVGS